MIQRGRLEIEKDIVYYYGLNFLGLLQVLIYYVTLLFPK